MDNGLLWQRDILSNGLTVLQYPRLSALTAQLSVAIKYGSNDDPDAKAGCAHFVEHMLVGGSQKRIRLHHEVEQLGGCSSFETSAECTFTSIDVFPDKLNDASRILSGLLFDGEFIDEKVELERKVILNEIAEAADNPHDKVAESLIKCLFKRHPIRNPVLGTKKTIQQLTQKEIKSAHETHYQPQNMILILTGKFSKDDADSVLNDFNNRRNSSLIKKPIHPIEKGAPKKEASIKRSGLGQAYLCFGLRSPPAKEPDALVLDAINAIIGLGESSRLFVELREKRALTYDFASMNISSLDHGFFTVACAVQPKHLPQTQQIIRSELDKLKTDGASEAELEKSKNIVIGDILRAMDNPHELPRLITDTEIVYGNQSGLQEYLNKLRAVTTQNIQQVANKYFQDKNYSTATVVPK